MLGMQGAGREANYWGETSLSCYERAKVHLIEGRRKLEGSHIWLHILEYHKDEKLEIDSSFKFTVLSSHKSAFLRQLNEVIVMNNAKGIVMNGKKEYNRCVVPKLTTGGEVTPLRPRYKLIVKKSAVEKEKEGEADNVQRRNTNLQQKVHNAETNLQQKAPNKKINLQHINTIIDEFMMKTIKDTIRDVSERKGEKEKEV